VETQQVITKKKKWVNQPRNIGHQVDHDKAIGAMA
jgi:hypothetical protein